MTDMKGKVIPNKLLDKVQLELISHVYQQMTIGLFASLACAGIVFIGLYSQTKNNGMLFVWLSFFCLVTVIRLAFVYYFQHDKHQEDNSILWSNLCVFGALLGGISWGFLGTFIFPDANIMEQMLIILMLSGVTAGAVPLSSGVPNAAIAFLVSALLPLIISIALFKSYVYLLFDAALVLYLIYSVVLSLRSYELIKNTIVLQFENDALLTTLEEAKKNLELANDKLEVAATHDPLTQVANRSLFDKNMKEAIDRCLLNQSKLALLYIDFDDFKKINDDYGHRAGDQFLILTIQRLKEFFGEKGSIARLGGDEFTVILENIYERDKVALMAEQLCQLLARPVVLRQITVRSSVSIGISIYPDDGDDAETLLQCADKLMYEVKSKGGNSFSLYREHV
jgi:diguanylate cyclase (GGDEF)-like protein